MICFDTYPWKCVYDINAPGHIGPPIGGPPTMWYTHLRIYRDISRAFNIPFGSYVQTFHAVEDYGAFNVYRNPSPSELRLNHSGALAFNSKMLIDFVYNNGSSSLFNPPGGDSNPNPLYYEKAECARRARNFGKALVRLKPMTSPVAVDYQRHVHPRQECERHAQSDPDQLLCRPRRRRPQHRLGGGPERSVPPRLGGHEYRHEKQRPARRRDHRLVQAFG
jgi:hypothetical protein